MLRSLTGRIVAGSLFGFLLSGVVSFFFLDHFLADHLRKRVDQLLTSEVLDVAAALERLEEPLQAKELTEELTRFGHTHGIGQSFFRVLTAEGKPLAHSSLDAWKSLSREKIPLATIRGQLFTLTDLEMAGFHHGVRSVYFNSPDGFILQIGFSLEESEAFRKRLRVLYGGVLSMVILLGSLLGWLATRHELRGLKRIGQVAEGITRKVGFDRRVGVMNGSLEVTQLGEAFDTMLETIHRLIRNQKNMMDNIAHDIRSPVARLRASAENALALRRDPELAGRTIENCDQILNLVNTLLEIAATETGTVNWRMSRFPLAEMVGEAAELFEPVIESKNQDILLEIKDPGVVDADKRVMQRIVANLLDNAIKYTPERGKIEVRLWQDADHVFLAIADNGQGIPADELPVIFNRFYRVDRSRTKIGSGLGLSFCKAAVTAMGGDIACTSNEGEGTTFTVHLKRAKNEEIASEPADNRGGQQPGGLPLSNSV